jgi:hypothetical protein
VGNLKRFGKKNRPGKGLQGLQSKRLRLRSYSATPKAVPAGNSGF